jgi:hypothetical protein
VQAGWRRGSTGGDTRVHHCGLQARPSNMSLSCVFTALDDSVFTASAVILNFTAETCELRASLQMPTQSVTVTWSGRHGLLAVAPGRQSRDDSGLPHLRSGVCRR